MSDADQPDLNPETTAADSSPGPGDDLPVSHFEVVPYPDKGNEAELYSFREAMPAPVEPAAGKRPSHPLPAAKILIVAAPLALIALIAFAFPSLFRPRQPVSYIDLGSQRFDPAGLSGRLVAHWETSASYQLFLDPIGTQQAVSFAAVAANPPRQISVTVRLLDAAGLVACEKQILLPPPVPPAPEDSDSAPPPSGPRQTATGDTVENMTGPSGKIAEIDLSGPLPCPAKAYAASKTWEFVADFPTPAEEDIWLRGERKMAEMNHVGNRNPWARGARLAAPIEGDDVIVGDNPSHGTVETSGGRVFLVGAAGMRNRTAEWQVFPAAIHFRCDKNGSCALTRAHSRATLQARLVR